jgi:hypothetical protein
VLWALNQRNTLSVNVPRPRLQALLLQDEGLSEQRHRSAAFYNLVGCGAACDSCAAALDPLCGVYLCTVASVQLDTTSVPLFMSCVVVCDQ